MNALHWWVCSLQPSHAAVNGDPSQHQSDGSVQSLLALPQIAVFRTCNVLDALEVGRHGLDVRNT